MGSFSILLCAFSFGSETAPPVRTIEVTVSVQADLQKYKEMFNGADFKGAAELPFVKKKVVVLFIRFRTIALMIMPVGLNCGFEFEKGSQNLIRPARLTA